LDEKYDNFIIDHHMQTMEYVAKKCKDASYVASKVFFGDIPTTGLVYRAFTDKIPDEEKWKVVGGMVGDGQPEKVPVEIWDMFPQLLETRGRVYRTAYGKMSEYPYPLYKHLSSPVNATCRMGNPEGAYEIIRRAKTPDDIITSIVFKNDKEAIKNEINSIFRSGVEEQNITKYLSVVVINTDVKLASRICSAMSGMNSNKTWLIINEGSRKMSLRGDLASYIGAKLNERGFQCGGHYGFYGGNLEETQIPEDIIKALRECLK